MTQPRGRRFELGEHAAVDMGMAQIQADSGLAVWIDFLEKFD
jgi:hypothetical protein